MAETRTVVVGELLREIDAATARMARTNPHRNLLARAGLAVIELATRAERAEHEVTPKE